MFCFKQWYMYIFIRENLPQNVKFIFLFSIFLLEVT